MISLELEPSRRVQTASWSLFGRRQSHIIAQVDSRRRFNRQTAQALDCLAHAIEYLEDTMPLLAEESPRILATQQAIDLLKGQNRMIFLSSVRG